MIKPDYHFFHRIYLALEGFVIAVRRERHMKIHLLLSFFLIIPMAFITVQLLIDGFYLFC